MAWVVTLFVFGTINVPYHMVSASIVEVLT